MPKHCIVKGCKSNMENGFPFPMDRPESARKWVTALEKHQELPVDYQQKLVCPVHFREGDFLKSKKDQISKKAVPSVFPIIPDDYVSEEEDTAIPESEIKCEPEYNLHAITKSGKTVRRKRLSTPMTEPESEEDVGSNYEPTDSNEEMSLSEPESEKMEDDSRDNVVTDFPIYRDDKEMTKNMDPILTFPEISNDEVLDSDYEPVTETCLEALQEKFFKKSETLKKETSTLNAMEEMIKNQATTIRKLEEELAELIRAEAEENKSERSSDKDSINLSKVEGGMGSRTGDYSNLDLQMFSISLYYFSPKVYAYLESIMPYLPPKKVVLEWVKSGHAFTLFPPGVLLKENFVLE